MSCVYIPNTDFSVKDALPTGDPQKRILGSDFDAEFNEIATVFDCKLDLANGTATGTTTFENVTITGDTIVGGNTSIITIGGTNATTNIEGDLTVNNISVSDAIGAVPGHRYWKILFNPQDGASITIAELAFRRNAKGFANGKRWSEGESLTTTITAGMLSSAS